MTRVLVTLGGMAPGDTGGIAALEEAGCELKFAAADTTTPAAELIAMLDGCDATFAGVEQYTEAVFAGAPLLKHVSRLGVGFDSIDLDAATRHGVVITTAPGTNDWAVADHAFGFMLGLAHRIVEDDASVKAGLWRSRARRGVDVWQKTIGIVGLGRIGKGVARRARGFDMRVLVSEPEPDHAFVEQHGLTLVDLNTLLAESDFVTLHLPMSPATAGFMNRERLARMKPGAYLINTARGGVIDEDALYDALTTGVIAGAAMDVRRLEPPEDSRFFTLPNVILTPHTAPNTAESILATGLKAADNILKVARGEQPDGFINPAVWARR